MVQRHFCAAAIYSAIQAIPCRHEVPVFITVTVRGRRCTELQVNLKPIRKDLLDLFNIILQQYNLWSPKHYFILLFKELFLANFICFQYSFSVIQLILLH